MVSQSTSQQDSPVDPWEGICDDSSNIHGSPSLLGPDQPPCHLDVRLTRHKAAWINPQCVQQELRDLAPQVPAVGNIRKHFVADTASPLSPSTPFLGDSLAETSLSEDTADSVGSASAQGLSEKNGDLSLTSSEEWVMLPGLSHLASLLRSSKMLATSPCPEVDGAFLNPSHLTASADEDMIISTMEKIKCNILSEQQTENWSKEEASGSLGLDQADSEVTFGTNIKQESGSATSSDSGYEGCAVLQVSPVAETPTCDDAVKEPCKCDFDEFVILELGEFNDITETCRCSCSSSKSVAYEPDFNSAERLARELYRVFRKCWMLSGVNYQLAGSLNAASSIVVNEERVREDFESSMSVAQEIKFKSRIRGTEDWAPPRFQIIFNIHPPLKRDLVVVAQNFFCAGCGTPIEPKFVKRLRYCEYLGKYFCHCCHSCAESCIPARILMMWDFRKYHVSNFSKRLLDSIWHQPIFHLPSVSQSLYGKAKELDRVKEIQEQLFHVKKLLKTCRFADSALKEFEQVPRHLTDELHLFSLEDLVRIKKGLLAPTLKNILKASLGHVAGCELCQGKGFICEFCRNTTVIFPFQTTTCRRCSACRACFHKRCFQSSQCPRCVRISARRSLLESLPSAAT
ncbi:protein associated with UVRAG as autophagy enhancer isoform X2 [Lemur catta]|uniref:protein associated with UVRAG as autophagy enhancer isoform X2 n=1 Tax=Lemur catta TaxID=9447 RepID=UPI001E269D07|nr:protein associated with UVRAG as autophagy enhancer isoform X2 [Lemur catta]